MARRRGDELEHAIEDALSPGAFVGYRESWGFVEQVEAVRTRIAPLIKKGDAARAVALLEMFIAGCYEKSAEIDDSSGSFGQFVERLFCDWIRARQAAGAEPEETAGMLISWMENDDYAYCHGLEKEAVKVLDRKGLGAFERAVRDRSGDGGKESYAHRRKVEVLKTIHQKRREVDAYRALCEKDDDLAPADCETLAEMCLRRRRPEDALTWVERGLELEQQDRWPNRSAWHLPDLKRQILKKLGRGGDALASAWEDYRRRPSIYSYEELMKFVPKGERAAWHTKALAALDGADLSSRIDFLVKTKEWERLAEVVEQTPRAKLVALSHYTTDPAAKKLAKSHPLLAAKLHIAMALRLVEAKKSKYYGAALGNLETARKILLKEGRDREWNALAAEIREEHGRKSSFMPGFERLDRGRMTKEPSFRDRARKRWDRAAQRRRRS
ncbi:MAG: hypothetical protein JXQ29_04615 [Planctomycetes bacterium]|nr:hypothetical protein [Planctomycetota bacterium]